MVEILTAAHAWLDLCGRDTPRPHGKFKGTADNFGVCVCVCEEEGARM